MSSAVRVAIDGPGGAGKTSVARAVADALGVESLDTGAMYRALAAAALRAGLQPDDAGAVAGLAEALARGELTIDFEGGAAQCRVLLDGEDVSAFIRGTEVTGAVSAVAANPAVRAVMVDRQRQWAAERPEGCVMEGRDITTVVLPGAEVRVYLHADAAVRARRRSGESGADEVAVQAALSERDLRDSTRVHAPLPAPEGLPAGVRVIDTTQRTVTGVLTEIMGMIESIRGARPAAPRPRVP